MILSLCGELPDICMCNCVGFRSTCIIQHIADDDLLIEPSEFSEIEREARNGENCQFFGGKKNVNEVGRAVHVFPIGKSVESMLMTN